MKRCPSCQAENADDAHFCESCGEYIHWEPTRVVRALRPPAADPPTPVEPPPPQVTLPPGAVPPVDAPSTPAGPAPEAPPEARERAFVSLSDPAAPAAAAGPPSVRCEPGHQAALTGQVRNHDRIVQGFTLVVDGLPEDWWTVTPASLDLVPFGSPGGVYERPFELRLHPPRTAEAEARPWPFRLLAISTVDGELAGAAEGVLEVGPYVEVAAELRPERASGRRRVDYALAVRNRANAAVDVRVEVVDAESRCRVRYDQQTFRVEPGQRAGTAFRVRPPKQILFGKPVERQLQVTAHAGGAEAARRAAVFRQKGWLPRWSLLLVPLVAAAAVAYVKTRPTQVVVPNLVSAWQRVPDKKDAGFTIAKIVQDAGLKLGPEHDTPRNDLPQGEIYKQLPEPGQHARKGTPVETWVATANNTVVVPRLAKLSYAAASEKLAALKLGSVPNPSAPADPNTAVVESSAPVAGATVQQGASVTLVLDPATVTSPTTSTGTTDTTSTTTGGGTAIGSLKGQTLAAASAAVVAAGLTPVVLHRYAAAKPDTVTGQSAPSGGQVTIYAARAYPPLAASHAGTLLLVDPATGKTIGPAVGGKLVAEQPAMSGDGSLIAFRRGRQAHSGQIWVVQAGKPASAHPVTAAGFDDRRPAISPDGRTIAFVQGPKGGDQLNLNGDQDLCFVASDAHRAQPSCISDPTTTVDRPAWSPDGKAILVVSRNLPPTPFPTGQSIPAKDSQWNLVEYVSQTPDATAKSAWRSIGDVVAKAHGAGAGETVFQAAWSPAATQVAFVALWSPSTVAHLYLADVAADRLGKVQSRPKVPACQVAWRPDGQELAVTQADPMCARVSDQGRIVRIDPSRASAPAVPLTSAGFADPAWPTSPPAP